MIFAPWVAPGPQGANNNIKYRPQANYFQRMSPLYSSARKNVLAHGLSSLYAGWTSKKGSDKTRHVVFGTTTSRAGLNIICLVRVMLRESWVQAKNQPVLQNTMLCALEPLPEVNTTKVNSRSLVNLPSMATPRLPQLGVFSLFLECTCSLTSESTVPAQIAKALTTTSFS